MSDGLMEGLALLPTPRGTAGPLLLTSCWISREAHPSPLLGPHSTLPLGFPLTPLAF